MISMTATIGMGWIGLDKARNGTEMGGSGHMRSCNVINVAYGMCLMNERMDGAKFAAAIAFWSFCCCSF